MAGLGSEVRYANVTDLFDWDSKILLGKGVSGTVYKVSRKEDNNVVAVKCIDKPKNPHIELQLGMCALCTWMCSMIRRCALPFKMSRVHVGVPVSLPACLSLPAACLHAFLFSALSPPACVSCFLPHLPAYLSAFPLCSTCLPTFRLAFLSPPCLLTAGLPGCPGIYECLLVASDPHNTSCGDVILTCKKRIGTSP